MAFNFEGAPHRVSARVEKDKGATESLKTAEAAHLNSFLGRLNKRGRVMFAALSLITLAACGEKSEADANDSPHEISKQETVAEAPGLSFLEEIKATGERQARISPEIRNSLQNHERNEVLMRLHNFALRVKSHDFNSSEISGEVTRSDIQAALDVINQSLGEFIDQHVGDGDGLASAEEISKARELFATNPALVTIFQEGKRYQEMSDTTSTDVASSGSPSVESESNNPRGPSGQVSNPNEL